MSGTEFGETLARIMPEAQRRKADRMEEELEGYWKRLIEFPGIVRRPEDSKLEALAEVRARVLVEQESDFQRILLVETPKKHLLLLLDGEIQFYAGDEQRYHECLSIVPVLYKRGPLRRAAIMGGGDGLAARELLRHFGGELELIKVIDIDPAITDLGRTHPQLVELNGGSLRDKRVEIVNANALAYRADEPFDLILCDLPDPTNAALGNLYTREFYQGLREQLDTENGVLATQIVYVPPLFDGVLNTLRSVFPAVREYAVWMYSFVRAGFALCATGRLERCRALPAGTRHLTPEILEQLFYFAPDEPRAEVRGVSTRANPLVLEWYARFLSEYLEERILFY